MVVSHKGFLVNVDKSAGNYGYVAFSKDILNENFLCATLSINKYFAHSFKSACIISIFKVTNGKKVLESGPSKILGRQPFKRCGLFKQTILPQ